MRRLSIVFVCFIYAVLFVSLFSDTTSPLFDCSYTTDSSAYQLIGQYIVMGKLPFVDIWEQKGPAVFYIEALGYWLTNSKTGIFILQVFFMCLTLYIVYNLFALEFSKKTSLFLVLFSCLSLIINYQDGNLVEEYTLPLLGISTFLIYKWTLAPFRDSVPWHNPKYAIVYGVVLGFCLMTRLTDALGICGAILVIGIYLIIHQQWKNLLKNVLYFLLGFVAFVMPFCVYFYIHEALYEMWYGTFIFNLSYAAESTVGGISDFSSFKGFLVAFVNSYGLVLFSLIVLFLNPYRKLAAFVWMAMGSVLFVWYINSNGYGHYGMLSLFSTCIIVNELYRMGKERNSLKGFVLARVFGVTYVLFVAIFGLLGSFSQYQKYFERYDKYDLFAEMVSLIPEQEKIFFVGYSVNPSMYLIGDIFPCYRYYAGQNWLMGMNEDHYHRVYNTFSTCKAKWILVNHEGIKKIKIQPILKSNYVKIADKDQLVLYRLKKK